MPFISDEFARNYIKTLVFPGAMERYRAEQERDQYNGKINFVCLASLSFKFGCSDVKRQVMRRN